MILNKKFTLRALIVFSAILLICVTALLLIVYYWAPEAELRGVALSDSTLPVSVTVYGRGANTISARIVFYSADGNVLNTLERSWPGWEITIDAVLAGTGSGWIVFPLTVLTDETRSGKGVSITRYYNKTGFPALYDTSRVTTHERNALKRLFALARTESWMPVALGSLYHTQATLRDFETGVEYFLFVGKSGSLSFR